MPIILKDQYFRRNEYGAICEMSPELSSRVKEFYKKIFADGIFEKPYQDGKWHRRHGFLGFYLNYDCYDISDNQILVQSRLTHRTKYGASVFNTDYMLFTEVGDKALLEHPVPNHLVAKLSKICPELGQTIEIINSQEKHPIVLAKNPRDKKECEEEVN